MNNGCIQQQPSRLYSICLNYLCNNLDLVCDQKPVEPELTSNISFLAGKPNGKKQNTNLAKRLEFKDKLIKFNHIISQDLLERLCELEKLNDSTIALFSSSQTCLKKFHIKNSCLSKDSIKQILKQHQIDELVVNNIQFESNQFSDSALNHNLANSNLNSNNQILSINDLVDGLNEWSLENLQYLNVGRNISLFGSILINLNKLRNLSKLNVSFTCFNNHSLNIICQDLKNLEFLDLSGTKVNDLSPLLNLKSKLKYLYMYNMRASLSDDLIKVVTSMGKLQQLDLSCDVSNKIFADTILSLFDVNLLLEELAASKLCDLKYLDISGKVSIRQDSLIRFMKAYPNLIFIGLALTNANSFDIFVKNHSNSNSIPSSPLHTSASSPSLSNFINQIESSPQRILAIKIKQSNQSDLVVTGESTEAQLVSSLKYYKTRHVYIQKALCHLFMLTRNYQETRVDLLQIVLDLMQIHSKSQSVQLAATTCIYNLTRNNLYVNIPSNVLTQIINIILSAMANYPNISVLQKNCLFILCNEQILSNCTFNKFECVKATLDCINIYTDQNIINSSVAICSQVALNAEQKHRKHFKKLTDPKYVQKLLSFISTFLRLGAQNMADEDSIIHSVLDIIWALSEDNLEWCRNFITLNGLNIYKDLIEIAQTDVDALLKSICMIYNLSGCSEIRPILFNHPIIQRIKDLTNNQDPSVKFISVGCLVNLIAYMPVSDWDWTKLDFRNQMELTMKKWNSDICLMIEFKHLSFDSLIKLTNKSNEPIVQIWSLWAIYYLFKSKCLIENGRVNVKVTFEKIITDQNSQPFVNKLSSHLLKSLQTLKEC